jgi:signal recognition particle subunit SRP54
MLDTAGRTTLDDEMMAEAAAVKQAANPHEVLLVADALTGQDAVNLARAFERTCGSDRHRADARRRRRRGGAALSMRAVTGKPIKLIGTGEKLDALEDFHPSRIADRILGHGRHRFARREGRGDDRRREGRARREKMRKGAFDLGDLREQLAQMQQMGGIGGLMGMMPGIAKMKNQIASANLDEKCSSGRWRSSTR